jgi:hypothetical protein
MEGANDLVDLFWIYYPNARDILANNYVFNRKIQLLICLLMISSMQEDFLL